MVRLYLIRHGRQCSRRCNVNVDLCEEGYRQASLAGERLASEKIQAVYSSDLIRAVSTVRAANSYWNAKHLIRPALREISFGQMEGLLDWEIEAQFADFKREQKKMEADLPYPGGECALDVIERAEPVFQEMIQSGYKRIAVVTHGGLIRAMTAHYMQMPLEKWRLLGKNLENSSITELCWDEETGRFTLERFNDYAHLEKFPNLLRKAWGQDEIKVSAEPGKKCGER